MSEIANLAMADLRRLPQGTLPPVVLTFDASSMPDQQRGKNGARQGLNGSRFVYRTHGPVTAVRAVVDHAPESSPISLLAIALIAHHEMHVFRGNPVDPKL